MGWTTRSISYFKVKPQTTGATVKLKFVKIRQKNSKFKIIVLTERVRRSTIQRPTNFWRGVLSPNFILDVKADKKVGN
jgi:hypothetical protein